MTSRNDVSPTYWVTDDDYPDICLFCHGTLQRLANLVNDDPFFQLFHYQNKLFSASIASAQNLLQFMCGVRSDDCQALEKNCTREEINTMTNAFVLL